MKKLASWLLILTMCLSMGSAASAEKIKLQFMGWEASVYETEANKAALAAFEADNPEYEVEYIAGPYSEHHSRLMTMMAGNAAPDVFYMDIPYYRNFIDLGMLLDVSDIFEENFRSEDLIDWSHQKMVAVDGKYYGIDSCVVGYLLMVNKKLFEDSGIELPSPEQPMSWDAFVELAKKLTVKDDKGNKQYGVFGFESPVAWETYLYYSGVSLYNDKGQFEVSNPELAIKVMENLKGLRTQFDVAPEAAFVENSGMSANQLLKTGKVAMVYEGSFMMQELSKMDFEYIAVAPPTMIENKPVGLLSASYNVAGWTGTKHPEAVKELMKYLCSEKFQMVFVKDGLWMSNRSYLYQPENYKLWLSKVHPEGFEKLAPLFEHANVQTTMLTKNASEVSTVITEEIQKFFFQDQPAAATLDNLTVRINEILSR